MAKVGRKFLELAIEYFKDFNRFLSLEMDPGQSCLLAWRQLLRLVELSGGVNRMRRISGIAFTYRP